MSLKNKLKKLFMSFLVACVVVTTAGIATPPKQVYASTHIVATVASNPLQDAVKDVTNSDGGVINGTAKKKVTGVSKDILDIVMIIVMTAVTLSGIWCGIKFSQAGDDSSAKSKLKGVIVLHVIGIVFLANYFGLVDFLFGNFKLF